MTRDDQHGRNWPGVYLSRRLVAAVRLPLPREAPARLLVRSKAQDLFKACHVLAEPSQNEFALFAARHFGTEKLKMSGYAASRTLLIAASGSLNFQATQASAIDKRLWILSDGSTTKLCNSVAG